MTTPTQVPKPFLAADLTTNPGSPSLGKQRPPRQVRTGVTSTGARKAASKSVRSRSREFALQALYQFLSLG